MTTRCQMLAHGNEVIERGTSVVGHFSDLTGLANHFRS
jgi:hypothetical protein